MKKHTEKPPLDDLFARKLGNASLRPTPDGFARLQDRMKPKQPEARLIFWKNPAVQRYVASAACLLLVAGLGGYFWASTAESEERMGADSRLTSLKPRATAEGESASGAPKPAQPESTPAITPTHEPPTLAIRNAERKTQPTINAERLTNTIKNQRPTLVTLPDERGATIEATSGTDESAQPTNESIAGAPNQPTPVGTTETNVPAERVLVVTIAEPQALVAARQAAQATVDQPRIAEADKLPKETKVASLWQQVKRVKQGDVFARRTEREDESGLLSRAYNGLRHSLDKDKSDK